MRGAATASGAAAAASCTKPPHAKIRVAPTGRRRTKQCASGAGRGSPRPWESTAPPVDGAAAAADGAMRALRREARKGRCYLLSGAVARVGLAQGRGLFLELLTSGRHVGLKDCFCPSFLLRASRQRRVFLLHLRPNGCKFCDAPRSEASPGETSPLSRSRRPPDDAPTGASATRAVPVFSTTRAR